MISIFDINQMWWKIFHRDFRIFLLSTYNQHQPFHLSFFLGQVSVFVGECQLEAMHHHTGILTTGLRSTVRVWVEPFLGFHQMKTRSKHPWNPWKIHRLKVMHTSMILAPSYAKFIGDFLGFTWGSLRFHGIFYGPRRWRNEKTVPWQPGERDFPTSMCSTFLRIFSATFLIHIWGHSSPFLLGELICLWVVWPWPFCHMFSHPNRPKQLFVYGSQD